LDHTDERSDAAGEDRQLRDRQAAERAGWSLANRTERGARGPPASGWTDVNGGAPGLLSTRGRFSGSMRGAPLA
jgi:hypothetical protein